MGLGDVTGSLEPGKEADLVIIETDSPNMFPIYDPYSTLVYSAFASNVRDVYVAGECLVEEKRLVKEDLMDVRMALKEKMERTKFKEMKALTSWVGVFFYDRIAKSRLFWRLLVCLWLYLLT